MFLFKSLTYFEALFAVVFLGAGSYFIQKFRHALFKRCIDLKLEKENCPVGGQGKRREITRWSIFSPLPRLLHRFPMMRAAGRGHRWTPSISPLSCWPPPGARALVYLSMSLTVGAHGSFFVSFPSLHTVSCLFCSVAFVFLRSIGFLPPPPKVRGCSVILICTVICFITKNAVGYWAELRFFSKSRNLIVWSFGLCWMGAPFISRGARGAPDKGSGDTVTPQPPLFWHSLTNTIIVGYTIGCGLEAIIVSSRYGDLAPQSTGGRIMAVASMVVCGPLLGYHPGLPMEVQGGKQCRFKAQTFTISNQVY